MDWKLVLPLSALGLLVGVLSLFGLWPMWAEFLVWLFVGAAWVAVLHFRVQAAFFWHGAITGLLGGLLGILMQVVFIETYLRNNPDVRESLGDASMTQARLIFLGTGVAISLVFALITGVGLWLTVPREQRARARTPKNVNE